MAVARELKSGYLQLLGDLNKKVNPEIADDGMYKLEGFSLDESLSLTKRAGYQKLNSVQLTEGGNPATFTGLFEYTKADLTRQQIATGLTGVYRYGSPSANQWNSLSLTGAGGARTGTAANLYDAAVFDDLFYLGNGVDGNLKYNGTTVYNMGITAPSTTATVALAAAGAGNLTNGTYSYKITFYNSTLGHESNPSSVTADVTVVDKTTDGKVALTDIPVSTDAQVNQRRIWRTTVGGGVWLLLATINDNTTTTYTDNIADSGLGIAIDGFGNGVPPVFSMIEVWQGYAFMAAPNSSYIQFSKVNKPNACDTNDRRGLDINDGDVVTGIKKYSPLVAFKANSIWNAYGSDRNSFGFTKTVPDTGSVNNACIVNVPLKNVLAFIDGNARFWFYNGVQVIPTALGLETDLNALNQGQLSKIVGSVHKTKNQCRWVVPNGSSDENDLMIWYDYLEDKWGTQPIANVKANYITELKDSASRNQNYLAGYTGYVWSGDTGGSDDGSAVSCEVIDRGHPNVDPYPDQKKTFYEILVLFKVASGTTITVSIAPDNPEGTYTSVGTIDCGTASGRETLRFNVTCFRSYVKITESGTGTTLTLRGWQMKYKVVGRIP